jgi:transcriptional regulator with XRE-family HTH domain
MSKDILKVLGKNIRTERLKKSLSQEKLAELAGLHRTYIGMIERAEKNITILNIKKVSSALKIKISDLLKGID